MLVKRSGAYPWTALCMQTCDRIAHHGFLPREIPTQEYCIGGKATSRPVIHC